MDYGVLLLQRRDTAYLTEVAQAVEELGYDLLGLHDSQSIDRELYATLGVVANQTERIPIGSTVTNPVTRHPTVTASGICTIDEISSGRAYLGIGTGESAVKTIGREPANLRETRAYIETVRGLSNGQRVQYEDTELYVRWVENSEKEFEVPIFLSAAGPKTLEMAGAIADGVFIANGVSPAIVEDAISRIETGAEKFGRDPIEVSKWLFTKINIADSKDTAINGIRHALAASANFTFRSTADRGVPERLESKVEEFRSRYEPHEHEQYDATHNIDLMEELGLTEFFADRFAVTGTVDECLRRVEELGQIDGLDGLLYAPLTENDLEVIERIGTEIVPKAP